MKLIEAVPKDPLVANYVDRYQFFDVDEPSFFKTIPNGKIEAFLIFEGGFSVWKPEQERFEDAQKSGMLPATNQASLLKISENLICLNIKLKLNALALPYLKGFYEKDKEVTSGFLFTTDIKKQLLDCELSVNEQLDSCLIDESIRPVFDAVEEDENIIRILSAIEKKEDSSLEEIAASLRMSSKTLYRTIKKHFNLTPKSLVDILRFEETTRYLKKNETQRLIEAISFGYYDQSHFIRECRKITGTTPKNLFSKMELPTHDLMIGKEAF